MAAGWHPYKQCPTGKCGINPLVWLLFCRGSLFVCPKIPTYLTGNSPVYQVEIPRSIKSIHSKRVNLTAQRPNIAHCFGWVLLFSLCETQYFSGQYWAVGPWDLLFVTIIFSLSKKNIEREDNTHCIIAYIVPTENEQCQSTIRHLRRGKKCTHVKGDPLQNPFGYPKDPDIFDRGFPGLICWESPVCPEQQPLVRKKALFWKCRRGSAHCILNPRGLLYAHPKKCVLGGKFTLRNPFPTNGTFTPVLRSTRSPFVPKRPVSGGKKM